MFDIDHFKFINDSFGHTTGDQALQRITQTVSAKLRSADVIGRYGGDEFVILLPQTSLQEALLLAERIRESVEAIHMETDKGPCNPTISIGIAEMRHAPLDTSIEHVVQHADKALYAAKTEGRNRTVIYDRRTSGGEA
jgi:diguanylate cyclase (GGDEF)-like protein